MGGEETWEKEKIESEFRFHWENEVLQIKIWHDKENHTEFQKQLERKLL